MTMKWHLHGSIGMAYGDAVTRTYEANGLNQYTRIEDEDSHQLVYDPDGNLLSDGTFTYTWDAENRLLTVSSNNVMVLVNEYDNMSRRIAKTTVDGTTRFLYDGWNMIRETTDDESTYYVWGLDLSGSLQGAGGIGGLLARYNSNDVHYSK